MTQEAFDRGNWQAVIAAHLLESHDPAEWLRYGSALLHTIHSGPDQTLPVREFNPHALVLKGGVVLAATADPWIVLDVPVEVLQQLEGNAELELEGLWQPLPQDVAKVALESKSTEYTTNKAP
jgi:hypothetical protein